MFFARRIRYFTFNLDTRLSFDIGAVHLAPGKFKVEVVLYYLIYNSSQVLSEKDSNNALIGFFLHIPFPPWDIFRLLPWDDEILLGLLGEFKNESFCHGTVYTNASMIDRLRYDWFSY